MVLTNFGNFRNRGLGDDERGFDGTSRQTTVRAAATRRQRCPPPDDWHMPCSEPAREAPVDRPARKRRDVAGGNGAVKGASNMSGESRLVIGAGRSRRQPAGKWLTSVKRRAMALSRKRKVDHFYALCGGPKKVLDVGVARESSTWPAQNYFLKTFRFPPDCYTGLGVEDLLEVEREYPGRRFVRYSGGRFPFADKTFDWAFCNAVVEHVGSEEQQLAFVDEMLRVAERVFFTTPNKYFPIESHTHVFFLHWKDDLFYDWCGRHRPYWKRSNLHLFSRQRLLGLMQRSLASSYRIYSNRMFGWPMTFTVVCRR